MFPPGNDHLSCGHCEISLGCPEQRVQYSWNKHVRTLNKTEFLNPWMVTCWGHRPPCRLSLHPDFLMVGSPNQLKVVSGVAADRSPVVVQASFLRCFSSSSRELASTFLVSSTRHGEGGKGKVAITNFDVHKLSKTVFMKQTFHV